jgi:hypothetical protein
MDGKSIIMRYDGLVSDRKVVEESWDLIERFIYPLGGGKFFQPLSTEGEMNWRRRDLYDDTAIMAADSLAASIHGSLTSPAVRWFDLAFTSEELSTDLDSKKWLDTCAKISWNEIQQSNFNLEVAETYLDLVSFGNMTLMELPKDDLTWKGIEFSAAPLREHYFEEDEFGRVKRSYRKLMWKPSQILSKFGKDKVPDRIVTLAEKSAAERMEIVFCIYPVEKNAGNDTSGILTPENRPFAGKYILKDDRTQLGDTAGYYEMPAYSVRWRRAPGSQWGYGPGHLALSTTITLNELIKLILTATEKVVDPASLVSKRGVHSDLDLQAGGQTIVDDVDKSLKPYESGARFDVSSLQVEELRKMIRQLFHVDQLELKESPAMSATEVMVRYELMNRLLGPTSGRLQNDLFDPVVQNTFRMLLRAGRFPPMPDKVKQAGAGFKVRYVGPLSRAQKSDEVQSVERWLNDLAQLSEVWPQFKHVPHPKKIAAYIGDSLNVPADLMRSESEIQTAIAEDEMDERHARGLQRTAAEQEVLGMRQENANSQ